MAVTIAAVMRQVRNYFADEPMVGEIEIRGNGLFPAPDAPFVLIRGSGYHDGVWACMDGYMQDMPEHLPDETFEGAVYPLHPPNDFLDLCREISDFDEKNPAGALQSESFGKYSYTRASGANGGVMDWQTAYRERLRAYVRMFPEVI